MSRNALAIGQLLLGFAASAAFVTPAFAQSSELLDPIKLYDDRDATQLPVRGYGADVRRVPDANRELKFVGLYFYGTTVIGSKNNIHLPSEDAYSVAYRIQAGDIIPLFDMLYRADSIDRDPVVLKPMDAPKILTTPYPYSTSYVLPLNSVCRLHGTQIICTGISPRRDSPKVLEATLELDPKLEMSRESPAEIVKSRGAQVVAKDDYLIIEGKGRHKGSFRHRVVQVVPPEPERHVLGWVEIEQLTRNH